MSSRHPIWPLAGLVVLMLLLLPGVGVAGGGSHGGGTQGGGSQGGGQKGGKVANVSAPSIAGSAVQGASLAASTGTWSGSPTSYAYSWMDCDSSGANCATIAGATGATDTLVASDVAHTVRVAVTATDDRGSVTSQSAPTSLVKAAPALDTQPPGAPSGLATTFIAQSSVTLSWNASSDNVGVTGYDVFLDAVPVGSTSQTSYAFSGLSCAMSYTLGVDAHDAAGNRSAVSTLIVTTTPCSDTSPPSAPTNLSESAATTSSITAGWTASTDNVRVTGYRVFLDGSLLGTTATTSYSFSGLACGTSHQVVVDAHDAAGNNSAQAAATMATAVCPPPPPGDSTPPSTPAALSITSAWQTTLALSWTASSDNVGVAGYGVYSNGTLAASSAGTSYTLTGLTCGTSYTIAIDAYDTAGNRSGKATVTTSTAACPDTQAPTPPTGVTMGARTTSSISISWTASTDNVGVAGYDLYLAGSAVGTATTPGYTFSGLSCGTNYTLGVGANDAAGNHSPQATVLISTSACPDTQPPTTPTQLTVGASSQASITVNWTASTDNIGVAGYGMYVNGLVSAGSSTSTGYTFGGLSCGTSYTLAVDAFDAAGNRSGKASITGSTSACLSGSVANLWVDGNGGSCTRQASSSGYVDAQACGSFQAAYAGAQCGDTVGVQAGTYAAQSISSASKACSSSTQVLFTSVPGGSCSSNTAVSMPSFTISVAYVKLECLSANPSGDTSCVNVNGNSGQHSSIIWNTIDHVAMHCGFFDSDHLRITNSTFGPDNTCQTGMEDLIDFRANTDNLNDVVFDHDTFETVTAPPDFQCGVGKHVDSMQGYGMSNFTLSNSSFYGCPGQCIIFRPYAGGIPGPFTFKNNFFNQAQDPGQAIDIGSDMQSDGDQCTGPILIENNTFENGAAVHGGCWNNPSITFRGNILSSSSCGFGGSNVNYAFNVFYSGTPCGSNAKSCTPAYLSPTTTITIPGDFHLAPTDTCARGAADQTSGNYPTADIDNQSRPQGATVDAGADEIP